MTKMFVELNKDNKLELNRLSHDYISCLMASMKYLTSFQIGDVVRLYDIEASYDNDGVSITPRTLDIKVNKEDIKIDALHQVVALETSGLPILKVIPHQNSDEDSYDFEDLFYMSKALTYIQNDIEEIDTKYLVDIFNKMIVMDSCFADSIILETEFHPYENVDITHLVDEAKRDKVRRYFESRDYNDSIKKKFKNKDEVLTWMKTLSKYDKYFEGSIRQIDVIRGYVSKGDGAGIRVEDPYCNKVTVKPEDLVGKTIFTSFPHWLPTRPSRDDIARFTPSRLPKARAKKSSKKKTVTKKRDK